MKLSRTTALTAALLTAAVVSFTGSAQAQAQAQPQAQPWGWGAGMAPSGYGYGIGYGCDPAYNYTSGWSYPPCYILPPTYSYTTGWNYPGLGVDVVQARSLTARRLIPGTAALVSSSARRSASGSLTGAAPAVFFGALPFASRTKLISYNILH
jgi:hypothetical protein